MRTTPDGQIRIGVSPEEWRYLGADGAMLADWFASVLDALVALRRGEHDQVSSEEWHAMINALEHRLEPRLSGIRDAVIRAHHAAGGSLADLALAMDVDARSTAQYRRKRVVEQPPRHWENWATGSLPTHP